jgi:hypothetical protein
MTDWRHQLAELDRTEPDRGAIHWRFEQGSRLPDPVEAPKPRIGVIGFAALIAIAGMALLFVAMRDPSRPVPIVPAATGPASTKTPAPPPCSTPATPVLGETRIRFNTDCLAIAAHRPTTITGKVSEGRHALLVCSAESCNKASQIARTTVVEGPSGFALRLPGLEPGTYFFEDPVHPATAHGTLYVLDGS